MQNGKNCAIISLENSNGTADITYALCVASRRSPLLYKGVANMELKGRFECYKTANGYFNYRLKAPNNETLAVSGSTGYSTASNCKTGIEAMKKWLNSPIEDQTLKKPTPLGYPKFELYQDREGKFRYRLFASNGELVVRCESGYATKDACKKGIASLAKWADGAEVVKVDNK